MIVMGIDPGFGRIGYGIVEYKNNKYRTIEYGCISTEAGSNFVKRLNKIEKDLIEICAKYTIDMASIEKLYFNTNITTGIQVAEARGVILNTLENMGIEITEYTPLQIKQAISGYGRADKLQMKSLVKKCLKLDEMPKLDDTTDALAMAVCYVQSYKMAGITSGKIEVKEESAKYGENSSVALKNKNRIICDNTRNNSEDLMQKFVDKSKIINKKL